MKDHAANGFGGYDECIDGVLDYRDRTHAPRPAFSDPGAFTMNCARCRKRKPVAGGRRIRGRGFICKECR